MNVLPSKMRRFLIIGSILLSLASGYLAGRAHLIGKVRYYLSTVCVLPSSSVAPENEVASKWLLDLTLRSYSIASDPDKYDTERSSHFSYEHKSIPIDQAALILVDVWQWHPNDGWLQREREIIPNIVKVLEGARAHGMLVVHAPAGRATAKAVQPLPGEIIVDSSNTVPDDQELHRTLQRYGIETLFYVGFAANMCVLKRPYGMERMHQLGYEVVLLRDCTTAVEYHDTLDGMWATRLAVRYVERDLGYTITSQDFLDGFRKRIP